MFWKPRARSPWSFKVCKTVARLKKLPSKIHHPMPNKNTHTKLDHTKTTNPDKVVGFKLSFLSLCRKISTQASSVSCESTRQKSEIGPSLVFFSIVKGILKNCKDTAGNDDPTGIGSVEPLDIWVKALCWHCGLAAPQKSWKVDKQFQHSVAKMDSCCCLASFLEGKCFLKKSVL